MFVWQKIMKNNDWDKLRHISGHNDVKGKGLVVSPTLMSKL